VGLAAACLGIALLAGTSLSSLTFSGPVFSTVGPSPPASERDSGERAAVGRRVAADAMLERAHANALGDGTAPASPPAVDINRADAVALQALPGVGPTLAGRIVAYREAHGAFRKPDDLLRVPGIGAKRYTRLQRLIRAAETP
jgi:competence protein ComEA